MCCNPPDSRSAPHLSNISRVTAAAQIATKRSGWVVQTHRSPPAVTVAWEGRAGTLSDVAAPSVATVTLCLGVPRCSSSVCSVHAAAMACSRERGAGVQLSRKSRRTTSRLEASTRLRRDVPPAMYCTLTILSGSTSTTSPSTHADVAELFLRNVHRHKVSALDNHRWWLRFRLLLLASYGCTWLCG